MAAMEFFCEVDSEVSAQLIFKNDNDRLVLWWCD